MSCKRFCKLSVRNNYCCVLIFFFVDLYNYKKPFTVKCPNICLFSISGESLEKFEGLLTNILTEIYKNTFPVLKVFTNILHECYFLLRNIFFSLCYILVLLFQLKQITNVNFKENYHLLIHSTTKQLYLKNISYIIHYWNNY